MSIWPIGGCGLHRPKRFRAEIGERLAVAEKGLQARTDVTMRVRRPPPIAHADGCRLGLASRLWLRVQLSGCTGLLIMRCTGRPAQLKPVFAPKSTVLPRPRGLLLAEKAQSDAAAAEASLREEIGRMVSGMPADLKES